MRRYYLATLSVSLTVTFLALAPVHASDYYTWTDERGTVHFVDSPAKIPARYRKKATGEEYKPLDNVVPQKKGSSDDSWANTFKKQRRKNKSLKLPYVSESNFYGEVLRSSMPVMVNFTAPWCKSCRKMAPVVQSFADEKQDKVKVVLVDYDKSRPLATRYGVQAIPTILLFKRGSLTKKIRGYKSKKRLDKLIQL